MRIIANRIVISLVIIFLMTYFWEFWIKPQTSPIYTEAVAQYHNKNYDRSLQLLTSAYRIDPNDTAILTLMGWNYLKEGDEKAAEGYFERAHRLAPKVIDTLLGYAYTEIALKKYERAGSLLDALKAAGGDSSDIHVAWATLYRDVGRTREAAQEFKLALAMNSHNEVAVKNLQEILNVTGDVQGINVTIQPFQRPASLTYDARVQGERLDWLENGAWKPVYLAGVSLTAALPGHFPSGSTIDSTLYDDWLQKISALGVNTIRVYTILPPAFYRSLYQFNSTPGHPPLRVLQGVDFVDPPQDDFFNHEYYAAAQKEIRDTIDVIHGQGSVPATPAHAAGLYPNDVSEWVTGILVGKEWLSHVVTGNNQLHPDMTSYQGTYIKVPSGSATEIFLAQMIDYAADYEERTYNWQHPVAFVNWPTLDPLHHPSESTILEEVSIRRGLGEHVKMPEPPYDDDDSVSVDPTHLEATDRFKAGYFAAYSVFPYYPDFLDYDPRYQQVRDSEGSDPYLGYLKDLIAHTRGLPLVVIDYGVPSSLGIGHFNPAGFDQGGKTEQQQGEIMARLTRNIHEAGAAGGMAFEWLDEWFRQTWLVRNFEVPKERKPLWKNFLDPAEYFGLMATDPDRREVHQLSGNLNEWENKPPVYAKTQPEFHPAGDRYDPARTLKALYADADEAFLYLRLQVDKLDNNNDGQPDWNEVNYLIGISTNPGQAGLTYLPFIAPVRFPMGMTYAIQISGPEFTHDWIASSYDPYRVVQVEGIPTQTVLGLKLGWKPQLTDHGTFESQIIEPNRRRFGRDGKYFPPQRYDRGILRYGTLDPKSPDYDSLAEWHANIHTNTIDLRIPWGLLGVTDPSSFKVVAGVEQDGTVITNQTPGFLLVAFSYRPMESARMRPVMEQGHVIADALPGMTGPVTMLSAAFKNYRWQSWDSPNYSFRLKLGYAILQKTFQTLPEGAAAAAQATPSAVQRPSRDRGGERPRARSGT